MSALDVPGLLILKHVSCLLNITLLVAKCNVHVFVILIVFDLFEWIRICAGFYRLLLYALSLEI
jgi:hypothetical protein